MSVEVSVESGVYTVKETTESELDKTETDKMRNELCRARNILLAKVAEKEEAIKSYNAALSYSKDDFAIK